MWYHSFLCGLLCLFGLTIQAQQDKPAITSADSVKTISFTGPMGSAYTVPEGKTWHVLSLFCNEGSYNIKVTSVKFKDLYLPGEKITLPAWCAEVELFDGNKSSSLMYSLKVEERRQ